MAIVHSESNLTCPLFQKAMKDVCHTCAWWKHIRGMDKNTGVELDEHDCVVPLILLMQFEVAHQMRHVDGTMQAFRTETNQTNVAALALGLGVKGEIRQQQAAISLGNSQVSTRLIGQGENNSNETCEEQGSLFGS